MILVGIVSLALLTVSEDGTEFVAKNAPKESQISLHRAASKDTPQEKEPPPIFATTARDGSTLKLRPSFPLSPGENYELRLTVGDDIVERLAYQAPLPEKAPPEIVNILPGTEAVPANLLKFYLEFDQPMREGREIFDKIHLEDQHGKRVHSPWRRQELWANDNKRLTLWIHPGRIKQGVNLRNELGPVLVPGETYDLVLENSIQAASGQPLEKTKRHRFKTTAENRNRLDLSHWKITPPQSPKAPVIVETKIALDPYLASRHLEIVHKKQIQPAKVVWDSTHTQFKFFPESNWSPGTYQLKADKFLEDLSGNTIERAFDHDLSVPNEPSKMVQALEFQIAK